MPQNCFVREVTTDSGPCASREELRACFIVSRERECPRWLTLANDAGTAASDLFFDLFARGHRRITGRG